VLSAWIGDRRGAIVSLAVKAGPWSERHLVRDLPGRPMSARSGWWCRGRPRPGSAGRCPRKPLLALGAGLEAVVR
jgi:hypothetical protein